MRNIFEHIRLLPRKLIAWLIVGYQHTLSPDHGPLKALNPYGYCRHSPTCSEYAKKMIMERGVLVGPRYLAFVLAFAVLALVGWR